MHRNGNPILTGGPKYGKLLPVAENMQCATVAQLVEQLTRNEQVAGSSPASSSNIKDPEKWLVAWLFRVFLRRFYRALLHGKVPYFTPFPIKKPHDASKMQVGCISKEGDLMDSTFGKQKISRCGCPGKSPNCWLFLKYDKQKELPTIPT